MTSYRLVFDDRALREFRQLDPVIQQQARKKLKQRLEQPRVPADKLTGLPDCYRLKLRSAGFRIVYQVDDDAVIVLVVAVAKRDSGKRDVYDGLERRLGNR